MKLFEQYFLSEYEGYDKAANKIFIGTWTDDSSLWVIIFEDDVVFGQIGYIIDVAKDIRHPMIWSAFPHDSPNSGELRIVITNTPKITIKTTTYCIDESTLILGDSPESTMDVVRFYKKNGV